MLGSGASHLVSLSGGNKAGLTVDVVVRTTACLTPCASARNLACWLSLRWIEFGVKRGCSAVFMTYPFEERVRSSVSASSSNWFRTYRLQDCA